MALDLGFFFSVNQKRTSESLSSHTETKGGSECFDSDFPCVSSCHATPHFYSVAFPVYGWEVVSCKVVPSRVSSRAQARYFPSVYKPALPSHLCARSPFIAFHLQICFSLPCFVTWYLDSVSISPLPAGFMLDFVSRGTELKGPRKAIEGEGVSFPISGVLIFSGAWLFVDYAQ